MIRLATCTYQEFQPGMGTPVRTTVGAPRFPLTYTLAGHATLITPTRPMLRLPRDTYTTAYLRHLDRAGVDAIAEELDRIAAAHPGRRLVLLCFDRLDKPGAWCHRTLFAVWWEQHTGLHVPELGAQPQPEPPALF